MSEQCAAAIAEPELTHRVLRARTAACHQQLDDLLSNELNLYTPAGYGAFMTLMLRARFRYGEALAKAAAHVRLSDTNPSLRQALCDDLVALTGEPAAHALSGVVPEPGHQTVSEAAGALYVFEGAALGAKFVLKRMQAAQHRRSQLAYLFSLAGQPASRWRAVTHYLDTEALDQRVLVASANAVFETLIDDAKSAAQIAHSGEQR